MCRIPDPLQDLLIALCCQAWSNRLRKCARMDGIGLALLPLVAVAPVYDFIFLHQGDPVDAVRNSVMNTFECLIEFHLANCKACHQEFCSDLTAVLRRITSQPLWQRNTLLLLTRLFTAVFRLRPGITMETVHDWLLSGDFRFTSLMVNTEVFSTPSLQHTFSLACLIIDCARDIIMAQAAGELYALIAGKLKSSGAAQKDHLDAWISALVFVSSQPPVDEGLAFFRPFLDKVFNLTPDVAVLVLEKDSDEFSKNGLSVLLHCYRFRLSKKGPRHSPDLFLLRHRHRIYQACQSQDLLLRLEALGVVEMKLCASTLKEFDILDLFTDLVELSITTTSLNLRNRLSHSVHRVSAHLVETIARASNGRPDKCTQLEELQEKCEGFFLRLFGVILRSLHAGSVQDVLASSLACMRSLVEALSSCPDSVKGLRPIPLLTKLGCSGEKSAPDYLETVASQLFLGMWSRLADNRENAMKTILSTNLLESMPSEALSRLWNTALTQLVCSPRPNINVVAPHMLRLLLHAPPSSSTLSDYSLNPTCLLTLPTRLRTFWTLHYLLDRLESQTEIAESCLTTLAGGKYNDGLLVVSVSGPFYALLGAFRSLLECDYTISREGKSGKPSTPEPAKLPLCCTEMGMPVEWLFENPMETSLPLDRANICDRFLALVPRIAGLCAAVVFHTSPEGVLVAPDNCGEFVTLVADKTVTESTTGLTTPHPTATDSHPKASVSSPATALTPADWEACVRRVMAEPEYLVVCCWRTIRELSAILGGPLIRCGWHLSRPEDEQGSASSWLSVLHLQDIADFFISQLIRSRHPGAFELTASGFENFCDILLSLPKLEVDKWPERWLSIMTADLTGVDVLSPDVCPKSATPNSAPVSVGPDAVLLRYLCNTSSKALLVVLQKTHKISNLLSTTVSALLATVQSSPESANHKAETPNSSVSLSAAERRLHATNVLRFLVRDATVGPQLSDHLEDILKCAIQGLNSPLWMIRNSSLMLYSTMMERIFGVNRTRDCESKKNRMSSSVFFAKFPGMRAFLLQSFEESLRSIRCAGSADIRIRLLAARSLTCLLQPACLPTVALRILTLVTPQLLRSPGARNISHNRLHGLLLQLQRILLGSLLLNLLPAPVRGVAFMRRDRLLWYEEIAFALDALLAPAPVALSCLSQAPGWTAPQVEALVGRLSRSFGCQEAPAATTTTYYTSMILAVFAVSSSGQIAHKDSLLGVALADCERATTPPLLPAHLSPLLIIEAAQFCHHSKLDNDSGSCDNLYRRLAVHLDPCYRPEAHTRTLALVAASHLLLANADSILDCQSSELLALFFALLSLIASDTEDETRFLAARFLRKLLEACRFSVNLPADPLPITILPPFIDFLLQQWSRSAASGLLEWLFKAVVEMWIQCPEGSTVRLFVPESTGLSIGPADLSRQVRRALTEWTAAVEDRDRAEWLASQIDSFVQRLRRHCSQHESAVLCAGDGTTTAPLIATDFAHFRDFLQLRCSQS
nr:unnamed protein product [Spirometra erinaceieuropaei]